MINPAAEELLDDRSFVARILNKWLPEKFGPRNRYVCIRILPERGPIMFFCSESQKTLYSEIPFTGISYENLPNKIVQVKMVFHVLGRELHYNFSCSREDAKKTFNYDPVRTKRKRKK